MKLIMMIKLIMNLLAVKYIYIYMFFGERKIIWFDRYLYTNTHVHGVFFFLVIKKTKKKKHVRAL